MDGTDQRRVRQQERRKVLISLVEKNQTEMLDRLTRELREYMRVTDEYIAALEKRQIKRQRTA